MKAVVASLLMMVLAPMACAEDEFDGPAGHDKTLSMEEALKKLDSIEEAEGWGGDGEENENHEGRILFLNHQSWESVSTIMSDAGIPFMTMFYAPWCGHCKAMKTDYAIASNKLAGGEDGSQQLAILAAVDCDNSDNKEICSAEGVEGFPTIKWFAPGQAAKKYEGERKWPALVKFVKDQAAELLLSALKPDSDLSVLKISSIKKALKERGIKCTGCVDKQDYMKRLKQALEAGVEVKEEAPKVETKRKSIKEIKMERRLKAAQKVVDEGWKDGNGKVKHIIAENGGFQKLRDEVEHVAVMFYAPWCSHCDTQKPNWVEASETAAESEDLNDVTFVSVECVANDGFCKEYGIEGYPTMHFLEKDSERKGTIYGRAAPDVLDEIRVLRGLEPKNRPQPPEDEPEAVEEVEAGDEEQQEDVEPEDHDEL